MVANSKIAVAADNKQVAMDIHKERIVELVE
jgi:hypothetical protein